MTDEDLRDAYQENLRSPSDRAACPAPEELKALVERAGGEDARLQTLDHVMACVPCREEFDLLMAVAVSRPEPRRWMPLLSAAAVILAVGAGSWMAFHPGDRVEPVRGAEAGVDLVAPGDGAEVDAAPELVWHAVPEANRYRVEVLDGAGRAVWMVETRDSTARVPAGELSAGGYRWWVQALLGDGTQAASAIRPFRLRQAP